MKRLVSENRKFLRIIWILRPLLSFGILFSQRETSTFRRVYYTTEFYQLFYHPCYIIFSVNDTHKYNYELVRSSTKVFYLVMVDGTRVYYPRGLNKRVLSEIPGRFQISIERFPSSARYTRRRSEFKSTEILWK